MKLKTLILTLFVILLLPGFAQAEDDFQYWSQYIVKLIDTEKVDLSFYTEGRFYNDASDNGLYLFSPKVTYDFFKYLSFATNYTYIQYKSQSSDGTLSDYKFQHRAEVEFNPHFDIGDIAKFSGRNRIEFRWIENAGSYNTRSRHKLGLTFPLEDNKVLTSIFMDSEFFYNWAENAYDENRTVPVGVSFKLNDKATLKTYWMIQHQRGSDDWKSNQILGTLLSLKF